MYLRAGAAANPFTNTYNTDWLDDTQAATIDFGSLWVAPPAWRERAGICGVPPLGKHGMALHSAGSVFPRAACCCHFFKLTTPRSPPAPAPASNVYPDLWMASISNEAANTAWIDAWIDQHAGDAKSPLAKPIIIKELGAQVGRALWRAGRLGSDALGIGPERVTHKWVSVCEAQQTPE